jgi:hypothetical protein
VTYVPPPPGTRTLHLQLSDGILLVTNEADNSASEKYLDKAKYFGQQLGQDTEGLDEFSAGVRVYDVSDPARPREAGFLDIPGFGTHRLWWAGGPLATASSMPLGYDDFILSVIDLSDPLKPQLIGHWAPDIGAGVRAYDISDPAEAVEVAFCVPPPPAQNVDPRASGALVPQSADLIVSAEGLVVASDLNAGISLIQFKG